jgi:ElaB/YqjD/DUF883 family membrane-anchored ribosome-binding protein
MMTDYNPGAGTLGTQDPAGSGGPAADFHDLKRDVAKLTETVTGLVKGQASAAGTTVREAMDSAKSTIGDTASQASDRVSSLGAELEATIERNPLTAVLIALSVGLVAGMLSHSRR